MKLIGEFLCKDTSPVYLGVKLDRQLNMKDHITSLRDRAHKRLNLLKKLACTKWGANKDTLRQLYLGYVRSVMDYSLPLQNITSASTASHLDRVQNQALRLICGAMKSTPTVACEIEAPAKTERLSQISREIRVLQTA